MALDSADGKVGYVFVCYELFVFYVVDKGAKTGAEYNADCRHLAFCVLFEPLGGFVDFLKHFYGSYLINTINLFAGAKVRARCLQRFLFQ